MDEPQTDTSAAAARSAETSASDGFAARIGRALVLEQGAGAMVASIESPWGYGKSEVIAAVQTFFERLPEANRPLLVHFNPWTVDPAMPFAPALFTRVSSAIRRLLPHRDDIVTLLGRYIKSAVVRREADSSLWWEKAGDFAALSTEDSVTALLDELQQSLAQLDRPLVVLIDDVDRLPPLHMFEMLRLVQSLTYLPRTAVLLGFDPVYVKKGLETQRIAQADEYLDRLIQVRVTLPHASEEELTAMLDTELAKLPVEALKSEFPQDEERFNDLYFNCLRFLMRSPREIKRIFDRVRFSERAARAEVAFADLFALETLAVVAPKVYAHIRSQPEAYVGVAYGEDVEENSPQEMIQALAPERTRALETVSEEHRPHVSRLLASLFPYTSETGLRARPQVFQAQGRIAAAPCLQLALRFGLPQDVSTLPVVKEFAASPVHRKRILRDVLNSRELSRFLSDLRAVLETQDVSDPEDFLAVMAVLSASPKAAAEIGSHGVNRGARLSRQVWWVLEAMFGHMEHSDRLHHLAALLGNGAALALGGEGLAFCMRQHGVMDGNEKAKAAARWCSSQELGRLQSLWVKNAAAVFSSSAFSHLANKREIFALLARIDPAQARTQIESLMQLEEDFDSLVHAFGEFKDDPSRGRYVTVDQDMLESLGELDFVRDRARQRLYSGPSLTPELAALYNSLETGEPTFLTALPERVSRSVAAC